MTPTEHVRDLRAAVRSSPEDWPLRLVLADALDDAGLHAEAVGQRWQAEYRRRPWDSGDGVDWYDESQATGNDPTSDVPPAVFDRLGGRGARAINNSRRYKRYDAPEDAEADLADALAALPPRDAGN